MANPVRLSVLWRFYLYALHGFAIEIFFTATWELVENGNPRLHGLTSVWAAFIYGFSGLVQERIFLALRHKVPLLARACIYLVWCYTWEFSSGLFLRQFNACPWDYEPYFEGHFMGLITLEYAPIWFFANILGEQLLVRYTLNLEWSKTDFLATKAD